jgi:PHS family inorganic phosphate transporter-like MFS transporter
MDNGDANNELKTPLLSPPKPPTMEIDMNHETGETAAVDESECTESLQPQTDNAPLHASSFPTLWYQNPHQITAMISNFSTSYNVVNIALVLPILEHIYPLTNREDAAACASSLLAGMILGQVVGGALGDSFLGRLGALRLVMALQIFASIGSSLLYTSKGDVYLYLAAWRFVLGVGAGGVYPLAAVLSAEQSDAQRSENTNASPSHDDPVKRVVLTFSTQGLGFIMVPIIAVLLLYSTDNLELVWRLLLGLGALPGLCLLYMQWRLYRRSHNDDEGQAVPLEEPDIVVESAPLQEEEQVVPTSEEAEEPVSHSSGIWESIRHEPDLVRKLLGTAGTWFLFDILFYGNTLFQPIVVEAAFGAASDASETPLDLLRKMAQDSLILTSIALPGYVVAGWIMNKRTFCVTQTPRYVMLQGFAAMGILYLTIGWNWTYLRHYPLVLVFLYGLTFFFANYGPNTSTFILPSLLYSPECRSTLNGISAASGKLGALVGATLFEPAATRFGDANVMLICSSVAGVAFLLTYYFVPSPDLAPSTPRTTSAMVFS